MAYRNPQAVLLGYDGLALHGAHLGEFDAVFLADRLLCGAIVAR